MSRPAADEIRVRHLLNTLDARPFGHPEPTLMNDAPTPPGRPRDWLDDIIDATPTPPPGPATPPDPGPPPDAGSHPPSRPWYSVGKQPTNPPVQPSPPAQIPGMPPGVHITFTPPPTAPAPGRTRSQERQARARRWLLVHGAAAAVGWTFGLYHSLTAFLDTLGPGGAAAGLAVAGGSWFAAEMAAERFVILLPSRTRPPLIWALRIPFATALLATAIHAPNALI